MKRIMLIGRTGAGKTSFCQALNNQELEYKKTQAIEILDNAIDTPGEYVENRSLYRALVVTAADADMMVLLQDCTDMQTIFAPGFTGMFGKPAIGLVTKIDLADSPDQVQEAEEKLALAGCERVFHTSNTLRSGIGEVQQYINGQEGMV